MVRTLGCAIGTFAVGMTGVEMYQQIGFIGAGVSSIATHSSVFASAVKLKMGAAGFQVFASIEGRDNAPVCCELKPDATAQDLLDAAGTLTEVITDMMDVLHEGEILAPAAVLADYGIGAEIAVKIVPNPEKFAALEGVKIDGLSLKLYPLLHANKTIVLAAVRQNGLAVYFSA